MFFNISFTKIINDINICNELNSTKLYICMYYKL